MRASPFATYTSVLVAAGVFPQGHVSLRPIGVSNSSNYQGVITLLLQESRNVGILNSAEFYQKALMAVQRIDRPGFACSNLSLN